MVSNLIRKYTSLQTYKQIKILHIPEKRKSQPAYKCRHARARSQEKGWGRNIGRNILKCREKEERKKKTREREGGETRERESVPHAPRHSLVEIAMRSSGHASGQLHVRQSLAANRTSASMSGISRRPMARVGRKPRHHVTGTITQILIARPGGGLLRTVST